MTKDFVQKQLTGLATNKATGLDGVGPKLLKIAAPVIAGPITRILNLSITTGIFPNKWKTAKVTPTHKKDNITDKNNFRPISILTTLSKLIERHIHNHFYTFLVRNNLLYISQSGFRHLHSCETARQD